MRPHLALGKFRAPSGTRTPNPLRIAAHLYKFSRQPNSPLDLRERGESADFGRVPWPRFGFVTFARRALWLVMVAGALYAVCAAPVAFAIGEWEAAVQSFFYGAIVLLAFWWFSRRAVRRRLRAG